MIEVNNLSKKYGELLAIDDISFKVETGEILGFLGPNGAGKTTTMRILTGYMPPSDGTARVAGYDVFDQPLKVKEKIGYLPENAPLYGHMTVRDYLLFMAEIKGVKRKERKSRVERVIKDCWLEDVQRRLIAHLSKGYKQRVGIAQALVHDPPVLVLDEPTIGLDPNQIIQVRNMIKGLKNNHTIILSTHILPEVSMTCDRIIIIAKGRLVAVDTPDSLSRRLRGSERVYLETSGPAEEVLNKIKAQAGVMNVEPEGAGYLIESQLKHDIRPQLAATIVNSGWELRELRSVGMSLEEVFLQLTTTEEGVVH
jgi:ABC-2 type transport system ATP-binding protein